MRYLLLAIVWLFSSGCASTQIGKLGQIQTSVEGARKLATVALDDRCMTIAKACPTGPLESCGKWITCRDTRRAIYSIASGLQIAIDSAAGLYAAGRSLEADAIFRKIGDGVSSLYSQLRALGVVP